MINKLLIVTVLLVVAPLVHALQSEAPPPPPIREPEPLPPKVQDSEDELEPQVIIRQEDGHRVEEYRSGGQVYMIRIVPEVGPPYYLIDTTGDGNFNERLAIDQFDRIRPAHWKIVEW